MSGLLSMKKDNKHNEHHGRSLLQDKYEDPEEYPYGLCIELGNEELEKLGFRDLPDVGDVMHMKAFVKVKAVRQSEDDKESNHNVTLQITNMGLEKVTEKKSPGELFHGGIASKGTGY